MAAAVLGLGMTVASCSDDDDDNGKSEEQQEEQAQQQADTFWDVVGQLTSTDNYTADYKDKTFEPTIGLPDESNPTVRIVSTNDMASAAQRFASLVGVSNINASTASYEWKDDAVGTLTYHKTDDGKSWATVDVNIRQMPALTQIIYRSPEQAGTNASNKGQCYYRFGDVVKRVYNDKDDGNKQKTEYWLCVRPAFNPEGKGDSHWISVSPLPKKNIWAESDSKNRKHSLPTGIGKNEEHMQNLAEMLYAIFHPTTWQKNVETYPAPGVFSKGLRMFHDFSHAENKVQYHSARFWMRVRQAWEDPQNNICQTLFGSEMTTEVFANELDKHGLNLLAKGYSWWKKLSWNMSLYQYTYKEGAEYTSNMHETEGMTEVKKDMKDITPIDIYTNCTLQRPYIKNKEFFGDDAPRYIVRHATGKELAGFQPNVYTSMQTGSNGITDVYTYNKYYEKTVSNGTDPEVDDDLSTIPLVGYFVGIDGGFYKTVSKCNIKTSGDPVAIVVALNGKKAVETGTKYNGLAMCINGTKNAGWGPTDGCGITPANTFSQFANRLDGMATTQKLQAGCGKKHEHFAALACKDFDKSFGSAQRQSHGFSDYFLPSVGQWVMALKGFGYLWDNETGFNYILDDPEFKHLKKWFSDRNPDYNEQFFHDNIMQDGWTSTPYDETTICTFRLPYTNISGHPQRSTTNIELAIRPFLAFEYNRGANEEGGNVVPNPDPNPNPNPDEQGTPKAGWILATNGKLYQNVAAAKQANATPVAVVAYYDAQKAVEINTSYHGLAIALKNATYDNSEEMAWVDERSGVTKHSCTTICRNYADIAESLNGIAMTEKLDDMHAHYPWSAVKGYGVVNLQGVSPWFLPSSGQWILAMKGFGIGYDNDGFFSISGNEAYQKVNQFFEVDGLDATPICGAGQLDEYLDENKQGFLTCTEIAENGDAPDNVLCFYIGKGKEDDCMIYAAEKTLKNFVRPFIAFE